jgi:hypothetical protein
MRTLLLNLSILALLFTSVSCNSVNGKENQTEEISIGTGKVEVYYFHYTRRCATCTAVENVTKAALEEFYGEEIKNGSIVFTAVNLDESDSEEIAEKLGISGQTLLVVAGDKKENLTTDAFMNAKSNPEKLREIIKSTIDPFVGK